MHNSCYCNEMVSLRNRVLMRVPEPDPTFVRHMRRVAHRVGDWIGTRSVPMDGEWIEKYTGRKRTMYENAKMDLWFNPFNKSDRFIKSFIKAEKISNVEKDPRMIQARNPRFNLELGNYLKPLEHSLYRLRGSRMLAKLLPPGRVVAKGMDNINRARVIKEKFARFVSPLCLGLDASRFDAHVSQQLLTIEHSVYLRVWRGDRKLQRLLSLQLVNHGWTSNGIRYKCPGGRMSGDMNTALGNCILMVCMIATAMKLLGFKTTQWDMLCDGDDALVIIDSHDPRRELIPLMLERAGMVMKIEGLATSPYEVEFCQSRMVNTAEGPKMVRDPVKVLSTALASNKWFRYEKLIDGHLTRLGQCYLSICMGVPVLQEFALAMLRNGKGRVLRNMAMTGVMFKARAEFAAHGGEIKQLPITADARASFEEAFGIPAWEQLIMEEHLRKCTL